MNFAGAWFELDRGYQVKRKHWTGYIVDNWGATKELSK